MSGRRAAIALLCLAMGRAACADDRIFIGGGDASSTSFYTYAGVIVPGPRRRDGRGLFQRYWIDRFGYEYVGAPGNVDARAWGGEAAIGYSAPTTAGWWSVSFGVRHTNTSLSPDDPGASARGSQTGPKLQVEMDNEFRAGWRISAIASYTFRQNQYWGRTRLIHRLTPSWSAGGEVTLNGNDETEIVGAAAVMLWHPPSARWSLGLKTGYTTQDVGNGAFAGVEFGKPF